VSRWLGVVALCVLGPGCEKRRPEADLGMLKERLQCGEIRTEKYDAERCRMLDDFEQGRIFDAWPAADAIDVWLGRQRCVGQDFAAPVALRIKRGAPTDSTIEANGFKGFALLPYSVNSDGLGGEFKSFERAVDQGPPFDAATIAAARQPSGDLFFPLAATSSSVATANGHWRTNRGRLIALTYGGGHCAAVYWKLP
jgi:hypothetical protein